LLVVMTILNLGGSTLVARVQSAVVFVVIGILAGFAVVTIANIEPGNLAPSTYPGIQPLISSVALTFFAFLGFGVVTFTAKDLARPSKQLPRAMAIAIGLATLIYVAVAIGVFGTLSVSEVIEAGPTAIALAAQPILGDLGYWLITVTALFATAGATNAGLYPAVGLSDHLVSTGQFPAIMSRRFGGRAPFGLLLLSVSVIVTVVLFDLSAVASVGSAVALVIFGLVSIGHLRIVRDTGAQLWLIVLAVVAVAITLITFTFTSLINEPLSILTLIAILVISVLLNLTTASSRGKPSPANGPGSAA
jgi:amino acid transporter